MTNKQIAAAFDMLAKLLELHEDNPFKIRSYANAYITLRKYEGDLLSLEKEQLSEIKGIGDAISDKIIELRTTGQIKTLRKYQDITPSGVQELLRIKGLGPKKVRQIWKELSIESPGELLYACNENRLASIRGFGEKLQSEIAEKVEYFLTSKGRSLYHSVVEYAENFVSKLTHAWPDKRHALCGDVRRKMPEVCGIEILTELSADNIDFPELGAEKTEEGIYYHGLPVYIYPTESGTFDSELFKRSCSEDFLSAFTDDALHSGDEEAIFRHAGCGVIPAEFRESPETIHLYREAVYPLIRAEDIKGIVHNHTTYSDGLHTLEEMSEYVRQSGFEYFLVSDHSKSAGYAGGLKESRVEEQWSEINRLNEGYKDSFRVFKGIESDILGDGSLDYDEEILKGFDAVIASVHSILNMDENKATSRLIRAIENPFTRILGHPTGRLLLTRPGYPINHMKVIDACAANNVVIELNANPQRLDIDWNWVPYCMEKGIKIAINPDAHSKEAIHYIKWGVAVARKGGLTPDMCLNTLSKQEFIDWLSQK